MTSQGCVAGRRDEEGLGEAERSVEEQRAGAASAETEQVD